jgi:hypothetical protein
MQPRRDGWLQRVEERHMRRQLHIGPSVDVVKFLPQKSFGLSVESFLLGRLLFGTDAAASATVAPFQGTE